MKENGQEPRNRRKHDPAHEADSGFRVGAEDGFVFLEFHEPADHVRVSPSQAMEIAVALMKYARRAGLKEPMAWPARDSKPWRPLNPNERERGER